MAKEPSIAGRLRVSRAGRAPAVCCYALAMDDARKVRDFWFGKIPLSPEQLPRRMKLWFGDVAEDTKRQVDEALRARFTPLVERALAGELAQWADGPRRRLSLILLLEQFPRNIYRGTARAFAGDEQALPLALTGMQSVADAALNVVERVFFYMPLQHAESLEVQEESVAAYKRLLGDAPADVRGVFEECALYAERHRDVIRRFGRFPHRNAVLGRAATAEESAWLAAGGETFSSRDEEALNRRAAKDAP
jgi:uncharacterized protein (DUF924 family)